MYCNMVVSFDRCLLEWVMHQLPGKEYLGWHLLVFSPYIGCIRRTSHRVCHRKPLLFGACPLSLSFWHICNGFLFHHCPRGCWHQMETSLVQMKMSYQSQMKMSYNELSPHQSHFMQIFSWPPQRLCSIPSIVVALDLVKFICFKSNFAQEIVSSTSALYTHITTPFPIISHYLWLQLALSLNLLHYAHEDSKRTTSQFNHLPPIVAFGYIPTHNRL